MQREMNQIFENTQQELDEESEKSKGVVQASAQRLMQLKHVQSHQVTPEPEYSSQTIDVDNWKIKYEE